jgi:hypothetical protein
MPRAIVLGMCAWVLLGAFACSGDDDAAGDGEAGSGAGTGDGSGDGPGSGSSGSGSGSGSGTSGSGSGSGTGGSGSGSGTSGSGSGSGTSGTGALGDGGLLPGAGDPDALLLCSGELCACADGVDNDNDGVMDGFDVECTGPYDDDEGSFETGISGDNQDPFWQDCFFDGNSGAGDDGCRYHTECLTGERDQDEASCNVSDTCVDFCSARTPPGCDCFGCCTVAGEDGPLNVITGVGCDSSDFSACTECVKSEDCDNECGECELCIGRTVNDLPDDCFEKFPPGAGSGGGGVGGNTGTSGAGGSGAGGSGAGGSGSEDPPPVYVCDDNARLCRSQDECPPGYYCQLGCCKIVAPE